MSGIHQGDGHNDQEEWGYYPRRVQALEAVLVEKGLCSRAEIQRAVDEMDLRSHVDGGRVVARAWVDPEFKARLLADGKAAVGELGYEATSDMPDLMVAENTERLHHLVVCTLCSCYPRWLLGRPPDWYKSLTYRSRAVSEPRVVMEEFGSSLPPEMEVRVLDSTAEIRYLVLPRRPAGTQGLSEEDLAKLVTRDSMIGVSEAQSPEITAAA